MSILTNEMIKYAKQCKKKYGVPASVTLGQIILESRGNYKNGLSKLAYEGKNLFGVKGSYQGQSVKMLTTEYIKGKKVRVYANFKKYPSFKESIFDHGKLLSNKRYTKYTKKAKTIKEYCKAIKSGGYATNPHYDTLLYKVIKSNNLMKYDK